MNYKAKLLRQDIEGLERANKFLLGEIEASKDVLKRQRERLLKVQEDTRARRAELARIEAGETVG